MGGYLFKGAGSGIRVDTGRKITVDRLKKKRGDKGGKLFGFSKVEGIYFIHSVRGGVGG